MKRKRVDLEIDNSSNQNEKKIPKSEVEEQNSVLVNNSKKLLVEGIALDNEHAQNEKLRIPKSSLITVEEENIVTKDSSLVDRKDNNKFRFFWWDAFESSETIPGVVLLFGKVKNEGEDTYSTCCVAVRNIERRVYFSIRTEQENGRTPVTADDIYTEVKDVLMKKLNISSYKAKIINKMNAFDPKVPLQSDYVEVRYSATDPSIPENTSGQTFSRVFGRNTSYLEILLLDRKIKGPCWLDVSKPITATEKISWCSIEINCSEISNLSIVQDFISKPPFVVLAIDSKTIKKYSKSQTNELIMIGGLLYKDYSIDDEGSTAFMEKKFCAISAPSWLSFPINLSTELKKYEELRQVPGEKRLLVFFNNLVQQYDPDIIVGHSIQDDFIDTINAKLVSYQLDTYTKLGRIRRDKLENQNLFSGRLVCDIKISAKELFQCRSYDLKSLCEALLNIIHVDNSGPNEIIAMYKTAPKTCQLGVDTITSASNIFDIMVRLNIIPIATQMTNIAGNVLSKSLLGGYYERFEFLLLHAFSEKNYIVPDKENKIFKSNRQTTHTGGLVLDAVPGLYNTYTILLDFKCFYPSIIEEYNVCFTTFPKDNDKIVSLEGIIPKQIAQLIESRRFAKKMLNDAGVSSNLKFQYQLKEKALKLTTNSIYGCLAVTNSRFCAINLAAFITAKGREILTRTTELVSKMNFKVIYGDTDSVMINTKSIDYDQAFQIGCAIKETVNKMYKKIEFDIDHVFKKLLVFKKKRYVAITVRKSGEEFMEEKIYKGVDIKRRDCPHVASDPGIYILDQILSDEVFEKRIENIYAHLRQLMIDLLKTKNIPLFSFVISKQLGKDINLYSNKDLLLPHVQVAERFNKEYGGSFRGGDVVDYVICDDGTNKEPEQRAYHFNEIRRKKLKVDVEYYLSKHILPVVLRICEPIEEIDVGQLRRILSFDPIEEISFKNTDNFIFTCSVCNAINVVDGPLRNDIPVLARCQTTYCTGKPFENITNVLEQLDQQISYYFSRLYKNDHLISRFCERKRVFLQDNATYSASDLHVQLKFFHHLFDLSNLAKESRFDSEVRRAYELMQKQCRIKLLESTAESNIVSLHNLIISQWESYQKCDVDDNIVFNF